MYANKNNSHTAFFTDTKFRNSGCNGLKGGKRKKSHKRKGRKTKKRQRHRRHKGGATMNMLSPYKGLRALLTRGENASKGLSSAEKQTLRGGAQGYEFNNASAKGGVGQGYHLHSGTPVTMYKNCGLTPPEKMGAGIQGGYVGTANIQKGAGGNDLLQAGNPNTNNSMKVDDFNQYPAANHGFNNELNTYHFAGSYPPQTLTYKKGCYQQGGKKGGGSKMTRLVGGLLNLPASVENKVTNITNYPFIRVHQAGGKRRRKKRKTKKRKSTKKKRKTRKQRGGYAQYGSNKPLTWTQQLPNGSMGGKWEGQLATPPTTGRTTNCHNNYNHFTGKNTSSPILDQDVQQ